MLEESLFLYYVLKVLKSFIFGCYYVINGTNDDNGRGKNNTIRCVLRATVFLVGNNVVYTTADLKS